MSLGTVSLLKVGLEECDQRSFTDISLVQITPREYLMEIKVSNSSSEEVQLLLFSFLRAFDSVYLFTRRSIDSSKSRRKALITESPARCHVYVEGTPRSTRMFIAAFLPNDWLVISNSVSSLATIFSVKGLTLLWRLLKQGLRLISTCVRF